MKRHTTGTSLPHPLAHGLVAVLGILTSALGGSTSIAAPPASVDFEQQVKPLLVEYCFACHAEGETSGSLALDELLVNSDRSAANLRWFAVLKQLQAKTMPPSDEPSPSDAEREVIEQWIKYSAFGLDPEDPDPGHVTLRRLNQVEYRNTIRDLLGVQYDTSGNFPADDTGHGFDNLGDVLSLSPLMLEKYVNAAKEVISSVVPAVPGVVRQRSLPGDRFQLQLASIANVLPEEKERSEDAARQSGPRGAGRVVEPEPGTIELSYYQQASAQAELEVPFAGDYTLRLNMRAMETYVDNQFDENRCEFTFALGDEPLVQQTFVRQGTRDLVFDFERKFEPGSYRLTASVKPLSDSPRIRNLRFQIRSVDLIGPNDPQHYEKPPGHERFFPGGVPDSAADRQAYARKLLGEFATRAFRRPIDDDHLDRLVELAESVYADGDEPFESGVAKSMTAILASPRFLFREESTIDSDDSKYPLVDQYALASRLSYFLWSSMPDEELIQHAREGTLRSNLDGQVARMLKDEKSRALSENFVGQWLRARAVDSVQINARAVNSRERSSNPENDFRRKRFFELFRKGDRRTEQEQAEYAQAREDFRRSFGGGPRNELTAELRTAMRRETEMSFEYILQEDRSLLELIDCDYTFLNEDLWNHYEIEGIPRITGEEMQLVKLPVSSVRGGVLTQGSVLAVTSNPDRTSPVKRGLFVLENLLGTPPPAPPPNIPALEDVESDKDRKLTLRETLAIHRQNALCSSCHNRMDPLGLALENFNALGRYRTMEMDQPIDATGVLESGEEFSSIQELKRILVTHHQEAIYRCMVEKMMTYALGRAVEYTDAHTVDELVTQMMEHQGRASILLTGIIHSPAFQRTSNPTE